MCSSKSLSDLFKSILIKFYICIKETKKLQHSIRDDFTWERGSTVGKDINPSDTD